MATGDIETYYEDGQWKNRPEGNSRASNTADTKADAQATGREMAKDRGVPGDDLQRGGRRQGSSRDRALDAGGLADPSD
jgi:hypothetical protein